MTLLLSSRGLKRLRRGAPNGARRNRLNRRAASSRRFETPALFSRSRRPQGADALWQGLPNLFDLTRIEVVEHVEAGGAHVTLHDRDHGFSLRTRSSVGSSRVPLPFSYRLFPPQDRAKLPHEFS